MDNTGILAVADPAGNVVRKVIFDTTPQASKTIGTGVAGYVDGASTVAQFNAPQGVALPGNGDMYVADTNNVIRLQSNLTRAISTFAGNRSPGYSGDSGPAIQATFSAPTSVAVDASSATSTLPIPATTSFAR